MTICRVCILLSLLGTLVLTGNVFANALDDLGSPDYAVRQRATHALLTDTTRTIEDWRELFTAADTPEQRHRLLSVIRHHVIRQIRESTFDPGEGAASIGFSHQVVPVQGMSTHPELLRGGAIQVIATLPGFPGHAHFQPGDLIFKIDDQVLPANLTAEVFQHVLRKWKAGQMLSFTALRDGTPVEIEIRLASVEALIRMYGRDPLLKPPYLDQWVALRDELLASAPPAAVLRLAPSAEQEPQPAP